MRRLIWQDEPSEETPIDADNLNLITNYGYIKSSSLSAGEKINQNTNFVIPVYYKVGDGVLDVYYEGCKLIKDTHYIEIGNVNSISNRIQLKDWSADMGDLFEFVVRGEWSAN